MENREESFVYQWIEMVLHERPSSPRIHVESDPWLSWRNLSTEVLLPLNAGPALCFASCPISPLRKERVEAPHNREIEWLRETVEAPKLQ